MAVISKQAYEVEFENGSVVQMFFTLQESGAFKYGNQTEVALETVSSHGKSEDYFDTRYDMTINADGSNFDDWCRRLIAAAFRPAKKIEEI